MGTIWESHYNVRKTIFYLLKGDYMIRASIKGFKVAPVRVVPLCLGIL